MLGAMALMVALLGVSGVEAVVSCGATLGPGGSVTLTADVAGCGGSQAITVVGPTTVDLAGHLVSCSGAPDGILVTGNGAVVKNGRVEGCANGVQLDGGGGHQVRNMLAAHNGIGYLIVSKGNTLANNGAVSNVEGFHLSGAGSDGNILTANTAVDNQFGFLVGGGADDGAASATGVEGFSAPVVTKAPRTHHSAVAAPAGGPGHRVN